MKDMKNMEYMRDMKATDMMRRTILVTLVAFIVLSCSFLDEKMTTGVNRVYDAESELEASLRGCIAPIDGGASWTGEPQEKIFSGSGIVHWSMAESVTRLASSDWTESLKFTAASSNATMCSFFANHYIGIDRCNTLVAALQTSLVNEEYKRHVEAEARFYRGFWYFNVVRFWGDAPLRLEPSTVSTTSAPRAKYDRLYVQELRDFEFAAANMRTASQLAAEVPGESRPDRYAAVAYLSTVWLTIGSLLSHPDDNFWNPEKEGRAPDFSDLEAFAGLSFPLSSADSRTAAGIAYREALRYAEMLIPESRHHEPECGYNLCEKSSDLYQWSRDFRDSRGNDSWSLPERIFAYSITPYASTAYLPKRTLPQYVGGSANFVKSDGNAGRQRPDRWFFQKWCETYPGNMGTGTASDIYVSSSDPRLDVTMYHTSYFNNSTQENQNIYPRSLNRPDHYFGMPYFRKYFSPEYDYNAGFADLYLMRLTQVYLNAAEAAAFIGETDKAYDYIEILHARARATRGGAMQPQWAKGQFSTMEQLINAIVWERLFELCAEGGHEWFDTHRFGATWLVKNIAKPKNEFLLRKEQSNRNDYGRNGRSYRDLYYGADFQYTEDPAEARKGLLLAFPSTELNYNTQIEDAKNDYGF